MKPIYVLDACAMLAVLAKEEGWEKVSELYKRAIRGEITLIMHRLNLLEVYYNILREYGKNAANNLMADIKQSPIAINREISDEIFLEAGRLKATYKISLADSVALAQAIVFDGSLVTSDHHEFDVIKDKEVVKFDWVR
jgi:predicted nucleic acid-binding protein